MRVPHSTCIGRLRLNGKGKLPLEIGHHAFLLARSHVVISDFFFFFFLSSLAKFTFYIGSLPHGYFILDAVNVYFTSPYANWT